MPQLFYENCGIFSLVVSIVMQLYILFYGMSILYILSGLY